MAEAGSGGTGGASTSPTDSGHDVPLGEDGGNGGAGEGVDAPIDAPVTPLAPLDNICVAEPAPEMTTRVAAVLPVPRAQFHKTEPQPATALPAEARAQLERPCAMVPASLRAPLAPEPAQQERIHATAFAWPPATSPAVARRARRVHSRPGPHKPPAMAPKRYLCDELQFRLAQLRRRMRQ